jgi:hypothetical protein
MTAFWVVTASVGVLEAAVWRYRRYIMGLDFSDDRWTHETLAQLRKVRS